MNLLLDTNKPFVRAVKNIFLYKGEDMDGFIAGGVIGLTIIFTFSLPWVVSDIHSISTDIHMVAEHFKDKP